MRTEIDEIYNSKIVGKNQETKGGCLERLVKLIKPLARLIRKKERKDKLVISRMKER